MIVNLESIATRHQVMLERLKAGLTKNYFATAKEVNELISDLLIGIDTERLMNVPDSRFRKMLDDLESAQLGLLQKFIHDFFQNLGLLSIYEAKFEKATFDAVAKSKNRDLETKLPPLKKMFHEALRNPIKAVGKPLEAFTNEWTHRQIADTRKLLKAGWREGATVHSMVKQVQGATNQQLTKRQAEAFVRTAVQHVSSTARMATWEANDDVVEGYKWVSTLDSRTTAQCRSLDGMKFKMGRDDPIPPIHISCRSTTIADMADEFSWLDEGATRASKDGYVDGALSYYDWLLTQDEAFQNETIGALRARLLRDGGLSADEFSRLNLDRNFEPLTLREMQKLEPEVFKKAGIILNIKEG